MSLHILLSGFFQNYLLRCAMQNSSGESLGKFQAKYMMRVFPSKFADLHVLTFVNTKY